MVLLNAPGMLADYLLCDSEFLCYISQLLFFNKNRVQELQFLLITQSLIGLPFAMWDYYFLKIADVHLRRIKYFAAKVSSL